MDYIALYRKWRPQVFEELIGQEHITRTLQNALQTGRVSHAYLFCGPRGTGKTSAAKILAKALNCEEGPAPQPCNQCSICEGINRGRIMDVLEIDAASNRGIDEIRELREKVRYGSTQARYKVYIIDEVHMLTQEAFNALLKTLEEPPGRVIFILATTEPHKLPLTILSRCQRFNFHRIGVPVLVEGLSRIASREGAAVEKDALNLIARSSEGGMRDALSLLEQVIAFGENTVNIESIKQILGIVEEEIFISLGKAVLENDLAAGLKLVQEVVDRGQDIGQFVRDLTGYFRGLILLKIQGESPSQLEVYWASQEQMKEQAEGFNFENLMYINEVLTDAVFELRGNSQPRFMLETVVFQICQMDFRLNLRTLQKKIEELESLILSRKENPKKPVKFNEGIEGYGIEDLSFFEEVPDKINLNEEIKSRVIIEPDEENKKEDLSIKDFLKIWKNFLDELKQQDIRAYSLLSEGKPSSIKGNILTMQVKNSFFQEKLKKPDLKKLIKEVFSRFQGGDVKLKVILGGEKEKGSEEENKNNGVLQEYEEGNIVNDISHEYEEDKKRKHPSPEFEIGDEVKKDNTGNNQEDSLDKAVKMFRGKVMEIEEIKKGGIIFDG